MMENKHLFDARDNEGLHNNRYHVAEMVAYLGIPPKEFQRRSSNTPLVFDEEGESSPPMFLIYYLLTDRTHNRQLERQSSASLALP